ncbi:MAG: hypothetical protein LUM44_18215 [Pyrinomonadaceae bacterium]|nr:hypothetical protein [Pyrinomonadaceae bacterium]
MKFIAKVLNEIDNGKNYWKYLNIGVFKTENNAEEQVGEYNRNYSSFYNTFFHFQKDGKDFALYSPDYTGTRIMELPSCKDIGGEEPSAGGFCPTDFFVPAYIEQEISWETIGAKGKIGGNVSNRRLNNPEEEDLTENIEAGEFLYQGTDELCKITTINRPLSPLNYYPFGFVAGCIWGDDSSWKIQYLDLSEVEKGILKREERFGYIELSDNVSLKDAISLSGYFEESGNYKMFVKIKTIQTFHLETGNIYDPFE